MAELGRLVEAGSREEVLVCIAALRVHADRAEREAGFTSEVVYLLRKLADKTESDLSGPSSDW